jgi:hypothetical protein
MGRLPEVDPYVGVSYQNMALNPWNGLPRPWGYQPRFRRDIYVKIACLTIGGFLSPFVAMLCLGFDGCFGNSSRMLLGVLPTSVLHCPWECSRIHWCGWPKWRVRPNQNGVLLISLGALPMVLGVLQFNVIGESPSLGAPRRGRREGPPPQLNLPLGVQLYPRLEVAILILFLVLGAPICLSIRAILSPNLTQDLSF